MTEDTFRIKPLVWRPFPESITGIHEAHTPFVRYWFNESGWWGEVSDFHYAPSPEEAKAAAEAHWRERLMQCLTPA